MAIFVLIGGGEIGNRETYKIDERIVKLAQKDNPKFLFIPTASNEAQGYIDAIKSIYGDLLKCSFDWLCLENDNLENELRKIEWADIIYVGGGNTRRMMKKWKECKVDIELKKYVNTNKVFCGLSAGSICWFESGISDSDSFENNETWNYSIVDGLGMIKGCHSPHYDDRIKEESFIKFIKEEDLDIIAIENNCAIIINSNIEIINSNIEIIKSDSNKNAYMISNHGSSVKVLENNNVIKYLRAKS